MTTNAGLHRLLESTVHRAERGDYRDAFYDLCVAVTMLEQQIEEVRRVANNASAGVYPQGHGQ